jgi:glycosyltransferase involved in cell wall biosynthesis
MDIAVVFPRFDALGGAEKFGAEVMREWGKKHDVTLYALSIREGLLEGLGLDVRHVECGTSIPWARGNTLALMAAVKAMGKRLGKHELYFLNMFPTHLIDRHPNIWYPQEPPRMLYDLYHQVTDNMPPYKRLLMGAYVPLLRFLDRRLNSSDLTLANSRFSAEYIRRVYGVAADVVYSGCRPQKETGRNGDYVLWVGRLTLEKRPQLAVDAARIAGMRLKIVGKGPEEARLRRLATDNVEFLGQVSEEEMALLYANALCTVYAPVREPFGLVPLDSLAAGTPVIGGLEGGYTEVLEDGAESFLVEPTPEKIAEKIMVLRDDPEGHASMSVNARRKAQEYPWSKTAEGIIAHANSMVG